MKVPLLDLKPQLKIYRDEILESLTEVIDSGMYILGPKVLELEKKISEYSGSAYAIGVSSGTDALLLALMALDVGPGDIVITSNFSFFATAGVISRLQAKPVFVDIDPVTFNINPAKIEECLESLGDERANVKAIIPVHLYGQCADMSAIMEIAKRYQIPVIEDAAQAIGAEYPLGDEIKRAGNLGDMGCFSFFPTKNLGGIGDGGMIVTSSPDLEKKTRIKRVHGGERKYYHKVIGGNFRLDAVQATVLSIKLKYLDEWHRDRQSNADRYTELFKKAGIEEITLPQAVYQKSGAKHYHIYNQYVIRSQDRNGLQNYLKENDIFTEVYYPLSFHMQECFQSLGYQKGAFPESEKATDEVLALPIYPGLTEEMQKYLVDKVKEFYSKQ